MRVVVFSRVISALLLLSNLPDKSESFVLIRSTPNHRRRLHCHHVVGNTAAPAPPSWGSSGRRRSSSSASLFRPSTAAYADPGEDHHRDPERPVNGEGASPASLTEALDMGELIAADLALSDADLLQPLAPPLSYDKFLKMQDKRVVVTIRYSGESGLRPYFLTVAKKLKASHPDVVIERRILPSLEKDGSAEAVFEILVDGKVVIGKKNRTRRQRVSMDLTRSRSVFVSMQELDVAISRARRRRRPTTTYGGAE